jgi:hypothetical protein
MLCDQREVQRANQRQPVVATVTEAGDFPLRIDDGRRGKGEESPGCPEACVTAGLNVAGSMAAIMLRRRRY